MCELIAIIGLGIILAAGLTGCYLVMAGRETVGCCPPGTAYIILGIRHWLRLVGLMVLLGVLAGCTDEEAARQTLYQTAGYTEVQIEGWDPDPFACLPWGTKNQTATEFKALLHGDQVTGTVCCWRLFGGCSVHLD